MSSPEHQAEVDEYNYGFGVFEEGRQRDPAWLTEVNCREPRFPYKRAECCFDAERWIAEIPRSRIQGTKTIEMMPARFRLCHHHATILEQEDSTAEIFESNANRHVPES